MIDFKYEHSQPRIIKHRYEGTVAAVAVAITMGLAYIGANAIHNYVENQPRSEQTQNTDLNRMNK